MTAPSTWKEKLDPTIREDWRKELEVFETQIQLKKQGRLEDKIFAETRLRRGTYGQRYDNGQRHDGVETRKLNLSGTRRDIREAAVEEALERILEFQRKR